MLPPTWFQTTPKNYTYGTHRFCDPEATYQAISPHFKEMGITRIADVTGLDTIGIPVCMAVRPNSNSLSVTQGKGLTLMLAKVSAAMEAVEQYHAENIIQPMVTATFQELVQKEKACDPVELNLHPLSVYRGDLPIPWIRGFDLIQNIETWVPYDLIHTNYLYAPSRLPIFYMTSNGLASGNHILEAASHAICEVVERDATLLWELCNENGEQDGSYVDPDTIDSPSCRELLEKIDRAGMVVRISHQTSDIGIPSFGCDIMEKPPISPLLSAAIFGGFGCHLSKEIALLRAITEAVQSRLTIISGSRDDIRRKFYSRVKSTLYQDAWEKRYTGKKTTVDYRKLPSLETGSLEEDVYIQLSLLQKAGFRQAVLVDLTLPEIGIPVVRVVLPQMEQSYEDSLTRRLGLRARIKLVEHIMLPKILGNLSE